MNKEHTTAVEALCIEDTPLARLVYKALLLIQYSPAPRSMREKYVAKIGEVAHAVMTGKIRERKAMRKVRGIYGSFKRQMRGYLKRGGARSWTR